MINTIKLFENLEITNNAKQAQKETVEYLIKNGFQCVSEYRVENRGDGWFGYIDIIATKDTDKIAIEFDRHSPRKKSIYKLNQLDNSYQKIVLLRGYGNTEYPKITIIPIKIRV